MRKLLPYEDQAHALADNRPHSGAADIGSEWQQHQQESGSRRGLVQGHLQKQAKVLLLQE